MFNERIGCIEVCENTFIGNGAIVMYGVRVAENNIIAAGSVVTKDTEPNAVYAGVPARKIGSYSKTASKRLLQEEEEIIPITKHNQNLTADEIANAWRVFDQDHHKVG